MRGFYVACGIASVIRHPDALIQKVKDKLLDKDMSKSISLNVRGAHLHDRHGSYPIRTGGK
jgi:hypothetical protein